MSNNLIWQGMFLFARVCVCVCVFFSTYVLTFLIQEKDLLSVEDGAAEKGDSYRFEGIVKKK